MIEIWKNKDGKCLEISVFILPDDDELIKRPFAYWHTRMQHRYKMEILMEQQCFSRSIRRFLRFDIWERKSDFNGYHGSREGMQQSGFFFVYYLHNRNLYTLKISSFIDVKMDTNRLWRHQYLVWAPFDWITAAICLGSVLKRFLRYFGVMAFETLLATFSIPFLRYI